MNINLNGWKDKSGEMRALIAQDVIEIMFYYFHNKALFLNDLQIVNIHSVNCEYADEDPCTHYDRSRICLNVEGPFWCQFVHQLSHELCHCSTSRRSLPQKIKWFDEFICCCSSYLTETVIAHNNENRYDYMFPDRVAQVFSDYLKKEISEHIYDVESTQDFFNLNRKNYETDANLIKSHDVYVRKFFESLDGDFSGLTFVGKMYLVEVESDITIELFLEKLLALCVDKERVVIYQICDLFGFSMRRMKDSKIEWVGEIPETWVCTKLKYFLRANDGGIWGNEPTFGGNDKIVIRSTEQTVDGKWSLDFPAIRDLSGINYAKYKIEAGDLLITKSSGSELHIGKTSIADDYFKEHECYYSNFIQRIRTTINSCFAWYILNSSIARTQFVYMQNSTSGLGNINAENIENIYVPVPPIDEQQQIADFLDSECGKIDGIKSDIELQIETLEKYKQSVITEAVTHGLNPDAPMKESGLEWINKIPQHWNVLPNKYLMQKIKYICALYNGEDILSLTMSGVIKRDLDLGGKMPSSFDGYQKIFAGNLLMCLFDIDVTPRCIGLITSNGVTSPAYSQFKMRTKAYAPFYNYYYLMMDYTKELLHLAKNLRYSLNEEQFGNIKAPVPPISEQKEIADYLDEKCAQIEELISQKQLQIETLESYKKSLIFEYVTGKKEVCE